jgi:hypothetical protein
MKHTRIKIKSKDKYYKCTSCKRITRDKNIIFKHVEKCNIKVPTIYEILKRGRDNLIYNN